MAVEGRRLARPLHLGLGLADVVQEGGQAQHQLGSGRVDGGVQMVQDVEDVHPALLHAAAGSELGRDLGQQPRRLELAKASGRDG